MNLVEVERAVRMGGFEGEARASSGRCIVRLVSTEGRSPHLPGSRPGAQGG
jgi:hypothetical protein